MKYDYKKLYEKNAAFLEKRKGLKKAVLLFNAYLPPFFALGYLFLWAYVIFFKDFPAKTLVPLFFSPALCFVVVTFARLVVYRPRPYEQGVTPLREKNSRGNSFPSRHLACAAALAVCFFPYLPPLGALFSLCTLLLGYARFAIGWHYPSDLLAGSLLGVIVALGGLLLV